MSWWGWAETDLRSRWSGQTSDRSRDPYSSSEHPSATDQSKEKEDQNSTDPEQDDSNQYREGTGRQHGRPPQVLGWSLGSLVRLVRRHFITIQTNCLPLESPCLIASSAPVMQWMVRGHLVSTSCTDLVGSQEHTKHRRRRSRTKGSAGAFVPKTIRCLVRNRPY